MSDFVSTPLVIGDPAARTVTIHLREGFGDGTDGRGNRLPDGAEVRSLLRMVDDAVSSVALGDPAKWMRVEPVDGRTDAQRLTR